MPSMWASNKATADQKFVFDDEYRTLIHGSLLRGHEINSRVQDFRSPLGTEYLPTHLKKSGTPSKD